MALYFVSDLHIESSQSPIYRSLLNLIRRAQAGDKLFLLGDIFDLMVGRRAEWRNEYCEFFQVLEDAICGEIAWVEGNHDFLLSSFTEKIRLYDKKSRVRFEGKVFHLEHGDLADQGDWKYLIMRWLFRTSFLAFLMKTVPFRFLKFVGSRMSNRSRSKMYCGDKQRVRRVFRKKALREFLGGADIVVMGHCHDSDEFEIEWEGRKHRYFNIGFPPESGEILKFSEGQMVRVRLDSF